MTAFHEPQRELAALPGAGRAIYRRVAALTDVAVAYGAPARRSLAAAAIGTVRVAEIPHGVPLLPPAGAAEIDALRARYGLSGRVVLLLGFVHPDKGADVLVEASRRVLADLDDVTVVIAGEPRVRSGAFRWFGRVDARHLGELRSAASFAGDRIRFPGFVADADLPALLGAATVMALPYRRITQSGIAHLCVAGTVPAVASRLDGLESTLGGGALYVPPDQPAPLAAALLTLLEDDGRQVSQRAALADRRDAWAPAAVAGRIVDVVGDLAGAPLHREGVSAAAGR